MTAIKWSRVESMEMDACRGDGVEWRESSPLIKVSQSSAFGYIKWPESFDTIGLCCLHFADPRRCKWAE